jgi:hypothetical protein
MISNTVMTISNLLDSTECAHGKYLRVLNDYCNKLHCNNWLIFVMQTQCVFYMEVAAFLIIVEMKFIF